MHLSATEANFIHLREHDSCPSAELPELCIAVDEHAVFSTGQLCLQWLFCFATDARGVWRGALGTTVRRLTCRKRFETSAE